MEIFRAWRDYGQVRAVISGSRCLLLASAPTIPKRGRDGQLVAAADAMYADQTGLLLYGELVDRYTSHNFGAYTQTAAGASIITPDPAVAGGHTNEYSVLMEGGYIINRRIEPFARYEFMHLQGDAAGSRNSISTSSPGA